MFHQSTFMHTVNRCNKRRLYFVATKLKESYVVPEFLRTYSSQGRDTSGPLALYQQLVSSGKLKSGDAAQDYVAQTLQRLHEDLSKQEKSNWPDWRKSMQPLQRLFGSTTQSGSFVKGLYIYGGVGTGKTMMMDLFYQASLVEKKHRVHFHTFMLDIHSRLHQLRGSYAVKLRRKDPVAMVAEQLSTNYKLLCLDEVEVTDIADALILLRLFSTMWPMGLALVATSNTKPEDLYKNGLNRQLFVPFFELLRANCDVVTLDKGLDYRAESEKIGLHFSPLNSSTQREMDELFQNLVGETPVKPVSLNVMMERTIQVPLAAGKIARFTFNEICGKPLGASDYIALVQQFDVIFIDRIPWLGDDPSENLARRMITLIDIMYENNTVLICSSAVELELLFLKGDGEKIEEVQKQIEKQESLSVSGEGGSSGRSTTMIGTMEWSATGRSDVSLAKLAGHSSFTKAASRRTLSRLQEMQSHGYLMRAKKERGNMEHNLLKILER